MKTASDILDLWQYNNEMDEKTKFNFIAQQDKVSSKLIALQLMSKTYEESIQELYSTELERRDLYLKTKYIVDDDICYMYPELDQLSKIAIPNQIIGCDSIVNENFNNEE